MLILSVSAYLRTRTRTSQKADFSKIRFAAVLVFHDSRDWGRDIQVRGMTSNTVESARFVVSVRC